MQRKRLRTSCAALHLLVEKAQRAAGHMFISNERCKRWQHLHSASTQGYIHSGRVLTIVCGTASTPAALWRPQVATVRPSQSVWIQCGCNNVDAMLQRCTSAADLLRDVQCRCKPIRREDARVHASARMHKMDALHFRMPAWLGCRSGSVVQLTLLATHCDRRSGCARAVADAAHPAKQGKAGSVTTSHSTLH